MAIDRIGKGGAPAPAPELGGSSASRPAGRAFEGASPSVAAPAAPAASSSALERLRSGDIDIDGYLNLKTQEATAHLASLPPVQLEAIRSALRDRLASDPALVDLVRTATGATAPSGGERDD